jgi:hypothetical protein
VFNKGNKVEENKTLFQNDPDLQNAFKGIVRTYWLVEVEGVETDTDSVQTDNEEIPHERHAGETNQKSPAYYM